MSAVPILRRLQGVSELTRLLFLIFFTSCARFKLYESANLTNSHPNSRPSALRGVTLARSCPDRSERANTGGSVLVSINVESGWFCDEFWFCDSVYVKRFQRQPAEMCVERLLSNVRRWSADRPARAARRDRVDSETFEGELLERGAAQWGFLRFSLN